MKKYFILASALALFISCKDNKQETSTEEASVATEEVQDSIAPFQDEMMENAVIYEANIRQY